GREQLRILQDADFTTYLPARGWHGQQRRDQQHIEDPSDQRQQSQRGEERLARRRSACDEGDAGADARPAAGGGRQPLRDFVRHGAMVRMPPAEGTRGGASPPGWRIQDSLISLSWPLAWPCSMLLRTSMPRRPAPAPKRRRTGKLVTLRPSKTAPRPAIPSPVRSRRSAPQPINPAPAAPTRSRVPGAQSSWSNSGLSMCRLAPPCSAGTFSGCWWT